jgi:hypothetical protein
MKLGDGFDPTLAWLGRAEGLAKRRPKCYIICSK